MNVVLPYRDSEGCVRREVSYRLSRPDLLKIDIKHIREMKHGLAGRRESYRNSVLRYRLSRWKAQVQFDYLRFQSSHSRSYRTHASPEPMRHPLPKVCLTGH